MDLFIHSLPHKRLINISYLPETVLGAKNLEAKRDRVATLKNLPVSRCTATILLSPGRCFYFLSRDRQASKPAAPGPYGKHYERSAENTRARRRPPKGMGRQDVVKEAERDLGFKDA